MDLAALPKVAYDVHGDVKQKVGGPVEAEARVEDGGAYAVCAVETN